MRLSLVFVACLATVLGVINVTAANVVDEPSNFVEASPALTQYIRTGNKVFIIMGLSYYKPTSINVFRIKKVVYNVKAKKRICSAAKI